MSNIVLNILSKKKNLSYPLVFSKIGSYYWNKKDIKFKLDKGDNEQLLYSACERGYIQVVEYIIDKGAIDINYTLLFQSACDNNRFDIIKLLFKKEKKKVLDYHIDYCNIKNIDILDFLYKKGVDLGKVLEHACKTNNINIVRCLAKKRIKYKDYFLSIASQYGYFDIVKILIENGADLHYWNDVALCKSAYYGNLDMVKYLIEKGADIFVNEKQPIREAYENKHFEVVEYLRLKALEQKNKSKCVIM